MHMCWTAASPGRAAVRAGEGSVRHSLFRGGGWTSARACLRALAVVRVLDSTRGPISSSRQRPPGLDLCVREQSVGEVTGPRPRLPRLEPSPPACVLSSPLLPGLSKPLEERRLGDLPPAPGGQCSPGFGVCRLRSPRAWYCASPLRRPCPQNAALLSGVWEAELCLSRNGYMVPRGCHPRPH